MPDQERDELRKVVVKHKNAIVEQMEKRKKARNLIVTTVEFKIKKQLRLLRLPITLFGEAPENRRDRLRYALVDLSVEERIAITGIGHSGKFGDFGDGKNKQIEERHEQLAKEGLVEKVNKETWFHQGIKELYESRLVIAESSIKAAKTRIRSYRNLVKDTEAFKIRNREIQKLQNDLREKIEQVVSEVADARPVSAIQFSPDSTKMATSSWTGNCQVWSVPECKKLWQTDASLSNDSSQGHTMNVGDIVWHPKAGIDDESDIHLATCSFDGQVKLWNLEQTEPLADLDGHSMRVSRLAFHPTGRFLGTACHDLSWRLWDLEQGEEVLHQEGHTRAVFSIKFHPDGGLACSAGLDGYGRIWDLRTGRCIMFMEGHTQEVYDCDFNANGVHVVTGSADNTIKVWDLRQTGSAIKTLPAHHGLITRVSYQKNVSPASNFIATGSYDKTVKLWSAPGYIQLRDIKTTGKVMGVDVSRDSKWLAASCYDKTIKLWSLNVEEMEAEKQDILDSEMKTEA